MAPGQEALYALQWNVPRDELSMAAQLEYDRLMPAWERGEIRPAAQELEAARLAWEQDIARKAGEDDAARQCGKQESGWLAWERKRAERHAARETGLAWGHTVDRSGTIHTFRFERGGLIALGIMTLACAAAFLGLAIAGPLSGWSPDIASQGDEAWMVAGGLLFSWFGVRLLRVAVRVKAGKVTVRGFFLTRAARVGDIRAITLQLRRMSVSEEFPHWIPRIDLAGGRSIWIFNLDCGPSDEPPRSYRAASLDEFRGILGVETGDADQSGTR